MYKTSRGFEPRPLDSESRVLTVTPRGQMHYTALFGPTNVSRDSQDQRGNGNRTRAGKKTAQQTTFQPPAPHHQPDDGARHGRPCKLHFVAPGTSTGALLRNL